MAGLKAAAPKVIGGGFIGLPITVAITPVWGLIAVGVIGALCVGGLFAANKVMTDDTDAGIHPVSIPVI